MLPNGLNMKCRQFEIPTFDYKLNLNKRDKLTN